MNIDSISNLIETSDISSFRTISLLFLDMIGFSSVHFCDGPYDGGKDFYIYHDKDKDIKQSISKESDINYLIERARKKWGPDYWRKEANWKEIILKEVENE